MPVSRYKKTRKLFNDLPEHKELFDARKIKHIKHHETTRLKDLTPEDIQSVVMVPHTWRQNDMFWKLAHKNYQDANYWWIIAQFNQKPTEAHVENGDTILIPTPLRMALKILGY
jgi:nucleoid-associated protein YgaU